MLDECLLSYLGAGKWRLLGRRMKPLTLAHRELLRIAGSPLVTGGRMLLTDLDLVAQLGSRSPREAARWMLLSRPAWRVKLRAWWLALSWLWRLKGQWDVLRSWLESSESRPSMLMREMEAKAGSTPMRRDAPPMLEVWARLVEAGFDSRAVLEEWPAGMVHWLHETLASRDGSRKFETEEDRVMMEQARKMKELTDPAPTPEGKLQAKARLMMDLLRRKEPPAAE
jgi:hypothetical protein